MSKNNNKNYHSNKNNKNKNSQQNQNTDIKKGHGSVNNCVFVYSGAITVGELAKQLDIPVGTIIQELFKAGKMLTINALLDDELIGEICLNHNVDFRKEDVAEVENFEKYGMNMKEENKVERAPVVTIMGHVDHGKTTLIDAIRGSNIVSGEAGSITQSIGAYQKEYNGKKITFLDTPGHEAFTAMRARGAQMTDIAVIVVAADDGVKPQTREAIDHAKAAGVSIVVAINKIDKPGANVERVKTELSGLGLISEDWGGQTIMVEISAKKRINLDKLLENIILLAEVLELKADPTALAFGTVIEASLDPHEGPKATLLVQNGTLKAGDYLVVGNSYCKVRKMTNEFGKVMKSAEPSTPVQITGLSNVPIAGDHFLAFVDDKEAKDIAQKRTLTALSKKNVSALPTTLDGVLQAMSNNKEKKIPLILKADTQGSVEAIKAALEKIEVKGVELLIVRAAAGDITESDVILAQASSAIVLGFNVKANALAMSKAKEAKTEIRLYDIIYRILDDVKLAMQGLQVPDLVEVVYGKATVTQLFKSTAAGTIAGSIVSTGFIKAHSKVRVYRRDKMILETSIASLKRFKDDVKSVQTGYDCGIVLEDNKDIQVDDVIESYGFEAKKNG